MELSEYIDEEHIDLNFEATNKLEALEKLAFLISKNRNLNHENILEVLKNREELGSTGIGNEIAIPHGKYDMDKDLIGAIAISKKGIEFDSIDQKPVKIFFVFISAPSATNLHLKVLAKVSKLLMNRQIRDAIINAKDAKELIKILKNE